MLTHSGENPFICTQCNYSCKTAGQLKNHTLTHSGEKPFSCKQCKYSCRFHSATGIESNPTCAVTHTEMFQLCVKFWLENSQRSCCMHREKHFYFKMLITFEPNVAQGSVASQNDHKSKACLPEASITVFTMYSRLKRRLRRLYKAPQQL